jgi:hypothetical protein
VATYAAIAATSRAVVGMLEAAASGDPEFGTVSFSICISAYLQAPLDPARTRRSIPDSLFPVVAENSACRDLAARPPLAAWELHDVLPDGTTAAPDVTVPEYRIEARDPAGRLHSLAVTVDLQVEGLLTSSCDSPIQPRH